MFVVLWHIFCFRCSPGDLRLLTNPDLFSDVFGKIKSFAPRKTQTGNLGKLDDIQFKVPIFRLLAEHGYVNNRRAPGEIQGVEFLRLFSPQYSGFGAAFVPIKPARIITAPIRL